MESPAAFALVGIKVMTLSGPTRLSDTTVVALPVVSVTVPLSFSRPCMMPLPISYRSRKDGTAGKMRNGVISYPFA